MRYGYSHDLTFALPAIGWMFNQSLPFNAQTLVKHYPWNPSHMFNFFVSHSQWNLKEVRKLVGTNAKIVTILRDPIEVFESGYVYFGLQKAYNIDINQFMEQYILQDPLRSPRMIFGKNQLLYNLGMHAEQMESDLEVDKMIQEIDKNFDLVMLTERMEESIVLMKNLLCWDLKDVAHLKVSNLCFIGI